MIHNEEHHVQGEEDGLLVGDGGALHAQPCRGSI